MRVAVFGSTGGTGRELIRQALAGGHEVTALARRPETLEISDPRLRVVRGDVLRPDTIRPALDGAELVFSALGIGMRRSATTVYSQGTGAVIEAMREAGQRRLVCVSTSSLQPPQRRASVEYLVCRHILHRILARPYADMLAMEQRVRSCDLDWTLVRAARLTNGRATGRYRTRVEGKLTGCWSISRADLAGYLLEIGTERRTHQRCVEIAY